MAYVNVKDWSVEQVAEWLKGIDDAYAKSFLNNGVTGHQLLNLRVDDLVHLGVQKLGHQELILEAVEHIRTFHYEVDKENLQSFAMRLSCASHSLSRVLHAHDENADMVQTQTLLDVHTVLSRMKPLARWLDKSPFEGDKIYNDVKHSLLQLGFELATTTHRDIFTVKPNQSIRDICDKITKIADRIIQELNDPLILQPATLDLCTLKKKDDDCGFSILPSNNGVHQITEIALQHINTKIEDGDEIVQVNYQTVVGWRAKDVMHLLEISPPEIVLTLKKRPRHTKVYGQIYMKPYRLPSRKRAAPGSRWTENLPSPRLLAIPDLPQTTIDKLAQPATIHEQEVDTNDDDDGSSGESDGEPPDSPLEAAGRLYPLKPRSVLQRRNTITGATPIRTRSSTLGLEEMKCMMRRRNAVTGDDDDASLYIRDKSASCSHGLERDLVRPTTVIGLTNRARNFSKVKFVGQTGKESAAISATSLSSLRDECIEFIDEGEGLQDRSAMMPASVKSLKESITEASKPKMMQNIVKDIALEDVRIDNIIKKFEKPAIVPRNARHAPTLPVKPIITPRSLRGKLDKCLSTPAYDLQEETMEDLQNISNESTISVPETDNNTKNESLENWKLPENTIKYELGIPRVYYPPTPVADVPPPMVEPRKLRSDVPPKPPPRTNIPEQYRKKTSESETFEPLQISTPKHSKDVDEANKSKEETPGGGGKVGGSLMMSSNIVRDVFKIESKSSPKEKDKTSPSTSLVRAICSSKGKSKKKNSLLLKRRKVSVNDVSPGEMQGFLYQRLKSKHDSNIHWEKRWFVLNQSNLYGFASKEAAKAECYIVLSGFTVTEASEVKSRMHAFKVYHTGTVFYFSAENREHLSVWLETIALATSSLLDLLKNDEIQYSETDNDHDDDDHDDDTQITKAAESGSIVKFNSLKKFASRKRDVNAGSTSLDRKRFFNNKSTTQWNVVPVPTAQFRSYRKIPASTTIGNFTSHIPNYGKLDAQQAESSKMHNASVDSIPNTLQEEVEEVVVAERNNLQKHASNPTLCNMDQFALYGFAMARPKPNVHTMGFVTLEELMMQESEGSVPVVPQINPNLIHPDVVYGETPIRSRGGFTHVRTASDCTDTKKESSCFGKRSSSTKVSRSKEKERKSNNSLPRMATPTRLIIEGGYLSGAKHKSTSAKSLKAADSYEMIFRPAVTSNHIQYAQNRSLYNDPHQKTSDERKYTSHGYELNLASSPKPQSKSKFKFFQRKAPKSTGKVVNVATSANYAWNSPEQIPTSSDTFGYFAHDGADKALTCSHSQMMTMQDYPGLEYPPVFEPETYSLSNPQGTLLRKQSNK